MQTTIIHHSADYDGIFCREIARKFLPDAKPIGWDYGNPRLPVPEGKFYILDLSPECLEADSSYAFDQCVWIDHHKSAIERFNPLISGYRIDGVAACRLTWQWFNQLTPDNPTPKLGVAWPTKQDFIDRIVQEPWAVRLAGEYDIWDRRDPDAELFQHGLRSRELTPETWKFLFTSTGYRENVTVLELLEAGKALQYAQTHQNASIIKEMGFDLEWEGLRFLACNHARYNSHLFTAGLKPEHDACYGFKWTGKDWSISLYHAPGKEHIDLSLIAVKYGGGGHRGACGFRTDKLPFL